MSGHWFCVNCDDVVFKPAPLGRWAVQHGVTCPVCHKDTADWKKHAPAQVQPGAAADLFEQMKQAAR